MAHILQFPTKKHEHALERSISESLMIHDDAYWETMVEEINSSDFDPLEDIR